MGTGNYAHENILAVVHEPDEWTAEDVQSNIVRELEDAYKNHTNIRVYGRDKWDDSLRSFPSKVFAEVWINHWNYDEVCIKIIQRCGYYQGLNYDYEFVTEEAEYSEEHLLEHPSVLKAEKLIRQAILRNTTQLEVSARFSNGETWYTEVKA